MIHFNILLQNSIVEITSLQVKTIINNYWIIFNRIFIFKHFYCLLCACSLNFKTLRVNFLNNETSTNIGVQM